ncbi:MAG TPA: hypothetical protein VHX88_11080 [Solirubrobacteraceae bacterium]|jgi:hypothetical protein|nr:hypothetical protein [Solirubrobacteraceae bacterium]
MRRLALLAVALGALLVAGASIADAARGPATRTHTRTVSIGTPSPNDLTLAELRFRPGRLDLAVKALEPYGADVVDAAALTPEPASGGRLLVLIVTRASALDTPTRVAWRIRARRALRAGGVESVVDVLSRPPATAPTMCTTPAGSGPLPASNLHLLADPGASVSGFAATAAIAEAWDAACGRTVDPAFKSAITTSPSTCAPTTGVRQQLCCPPTAQCVPCTVCGCPPCGPPVQASEALIVCPLADSEARPRVCVA